jgi:hypothetical protein
VTMDNADAKRLVDFAAGWRSRCAGRSTRSPPRCSCCRRRRRRDARRPPTHRRDRLLRLSVGGPPARLTGPRAAGGRWRVARPASTAPV